MFYVRSSEYREAEIRRNLSAELDSLQNRPLDNKLRTSTQSRSVTSTVEFFRNDIEQDSPLDQTKGSIRLLIFTKASTISGKFKLT